MNAEEKTPGKRWIPSRSKMLGRRDFSTGFSPTHLDPAAASRPYFHLRYLQALLTTMSKTSHHLQTLPLPPDLTAVFKVIPLDSKI
jgi:hypothetical protein